MKKFLITAIFLGCLANGYSQCFPLDTGKLKQSYHELMNNPRTIQREKAFFDAFPSSWMELILTYRYHNAKEYDKTMNYLHAEHIYAFGDLTLIPDSTYIEKFIHLAIGGKWDADSPNVRFQETLHRNMEKKTNVFFQLLSKQSRGYQLRFWLFFWSSMFHTEDGGSLGHEQEYNMMCESIKNKVKAKYPDEVKTMEIALPYALGEVLGSFGLFEDFPHLYFSK